MSEPTIPRDDIVRLNVGGEYFMTTRDTLKQRHWVSTTIDTADHGNTSSPSRTAGHGNIRNSAMSIPVSEYLDTLLDNDCEEGEGFSSMRDHTGALFIDRSPQLFGIILEYMRTGELHIPHQLLATQAIHSPPHHNYFATNSSSGLSASSASLPPSAYSAAPSSSAPSSSTASSIASRIHNLSISGFAGNAQGGSGGNDRGISRSSSFREHDRQDSQVVDVSGMPSAISPREYIKNASSSSSSSANNGNGLGESVLPDSTVFLDQANHLYNMFIMKLLREADFYMIDISSQLFNIVGDGIFVSNAKQKKCMLFFDKDPLNRPASLFMNGIFMNEFVVDKEVCIRNGVIEVHQNDPRFATPQIMYLLYPSETPGDRTGSGAGRSSGSLLFGRKRLSSFDGGRFSSTMEALFTDGIKTTNENTLQDEATAESSSSGTSTSPTKGSKKRTGNSSSIFEMLMQKVPHGKSSVSRESSIDAESPTSSSSSSSSSSSNRNNTSSARNGLVFSDANNTSCNDRSVALQVKDLRNFRNQVTLLPAMSPQAMQLLMDRMYMDLEDFNHNITFQRVDNSHMKIVETMFRHVTGQKERPGSQNLTQTTFDLDPIPDNDARTRILGTSSKHRNRLSTSGDKIILETVHVIMDNNFLAKAKDNFLYIESRNRCYWIRNGNLLVFELANKKL